MGKTTGQTDLAFVAVEVTPGTMVTPAGTDVLRMIADADVDQAKAVFESLERVNSYSITGLLSARYNPLAFSLQAYAKRTGTVDTGVTSLRTLFKNALGRETVNAGSNITYNLARTTDTDLNFSLFYRKGGMCFQCSGCFINDLSIPFQADPSEAAIVRANFSGSGYRLHWAGDTTITEALATTEAGLTQFKVAVADLAPSDHATAAVAVAGKFTIGAYVTVGALTTSHKITDINPTTGVVTVTPAFGSDQASGSTVRGWTPTETDSGAPIAGHRGLLSYGGNDFLTVLRGTFRLTNNRRALVEEKNNQEYPTSDAREGKRRVTLEGLTAYFDPRAAVKGDLFRALADQLTQKAIILNFGNVSGSILRINMPQAITQTPRLVGEGIVQIDMSQMGIASASLDDECSIVTL